MAFSFCGRRVAVFWLTPLIACGGGIAAAQGAPTGTAWKPPAFTPIEQVKLNGFDKTCLDRSVRRLRQKPLDDDGFVLADVSLDQKRKYTNYSGDISGRYVGIAAILRTHYPAEFGGLDAMVAKIGTYQKPDGHFGAEQKMPPINTGVDLPICWGHGRLLAGLIEAHERARTPGALDMARKLGDYFIATDGIYCKEENKKLGGGYAAAFGTCYLSCIEGLVALARAAKDDRYLRQAVRMAELAADPAFVPGYHSHGRLSTLRGILDIYRRTGEVKWLQIVERDVRTIREQYRYPTGGIPESFKYGASPDEGCSVADWVRMNIDLWQLTGQGHYLDETERCLHNHFLWQLLPGGGAGHRNLQSVEGHPAILAVKATDAWWCCAWHWPWGMADAMRAAVTGGDAGPRVNLILDLDAAVTVAGAKWELAVRRAEGGLDVTAKPATAMTATLRIHRPAWAQGAKVETPAGLKYKEEGSDWAIEGRWEGSVAVRVRWPRAVRVEPLVVNEAKKPADAGPKGVLFVGHDLLVAEDLEPNAWIFAASRKSLPFILLPKSGPGEGDKVRAESADSAAEAADPSKRRALELRPMRRMVGEPPRRAMYIFNLVEAPMDPARSAR
jgi:DUF1680 family protein